MNGGDNEEEYQLKIPGLIFRYAYIPVLISLSNKFESFSKIVDHVQGQGINRFESRAYTLVFEHFESVYNTAIGR